MALSGTVRTFWIQDDGHEAFMLAVCRPAVQ
jgi:hypothetical protein